MTGAPETRYTDRDVRENVELSELAIAYVEEYTGEFQYLIDMKMRLANGSGLTTPMIKGVLNCMRADPRVTGLPVPLPPEEGTVTELRPKREKRKPYVGSQQCGAAKKLIEHNHHRWETDTEMGWCEGFHLINRERDLDMKVIVKRPFAMARGGKMIHLVGPSERSAVRWEAKPHEWGFDTEGWCPVLLLKTACKYPSYLKGPVLLSAEGADRLKEGDEIGYVPYCPHCMEVMRDYQSTGSDTDS